VRARRPAREFVLPRQLRLTVAPARTDALLVELRSLEGLITLSAQRGSAVHPRGDVLEVLVLDRAMNSLMHILDKHGLGQPDGLTMASSMPVGVSAAGFGNRIAEDSSRANWEEMELLLGHESNMTPGGMVLMFVAGAIAVFGIASGTMHYVLASMLIAPGFEPLVRIALGALSARGGWRRGLRHTAVAYAILAAGAFAAAALLQFSGGTETGGGSSIVNYWTTFSLPGIATSMLASIAGAMLIAAHRALLTSGVMVALSLVPAAALACMAVVAGEWGLAGRAALRWVLEVGFVLGLSMLVFAWIRRQSRRRTSMR
jgi:hypothetical protein